MIRIAIWAGSMRKGPSKIKLKILLRWKKNLQLYLHWSFPHTACRNCYPDHELHHLYIWTDVYVTDILCSALCIYVLCWSSSYFVSILLPHFVLQWVIERDERVRNAQVAYDANQKEIARLQAFVDRSVRTKYGCVKDCSHRN